MQSWIAIKCQLTAPSVQALSTLFYLLPTTPSPCSSAPLPPVATHCKPIVARTHNAPSRDAWRLLDPPLHSALTRDVYIPSFSSCTYNIVLQQPDQGTCSMLDPLNQQAGYAPLKACASAAAATAAAAAAQPAVSARPLACSCSHRRSMPSRCARPTTPTTRPSSRSSAWVMISSRSSAFARAAVNG